MKITRYEIDMLNVKSADALLIHFYDDDKNFEYIVLIDGGNYEDGKTIANFIRKNYSQTYIDLAICSHCDADHFGGLLYLLEQQRDNGDDNMDISEIWVDDPANHVELGQVKWIRKEETLAVQARSVYDYGEENFIDVIEDLVKQKKIKWYEPFSDATGTSFISEKWSGIIKVLGPSTTYFSSLVPDFRNELKKKNYDTDETNDDPSEFKEGKAYSKTLEEAGDDPSTHNQSSVIVLFTPSNGDKYLFMGDAGRDALDNISQTTIDSLQNIFWLKVPHHGSKYNMDNDVINHLHPKVAFISTEKYGHYLSKAVVNVLKAVRAKVYSTNVHGSISHNNNMPSHEGYGPITPL